MQASSAPAKIPLPWAANGSKNTIPTPSQVSTNPGAASYNDGFPPLTMTPLASGGLPPQGQDFNGALFAVTSILQYLNVGYVFLYDPTYQTNIGGYPAGATVASATTAGRKWLSTVDGNTTNPDTGGAGWLRADNSLLFGSAKYITNGTFSWLCPAGVTMLDEVIVIGAGGAGAPCQTSGTATINNLSGGGGGAGGIGIHKNFAVTPGTSYSIVVPIGAPSGTAVSPAATAFGITANSGNSAVFTDVGTPSSPGGIGGTCSGANFLNLQGSDGSDGTSSAVYFAGNGGPGYLGAGAGRAANHGGLVGTAPGAGGGGAYDSNATNTAYVGGTGATGGVLFTYRTPS